MEDMQLLDSIERYLNGTMLPEERKYFQQLRKNTPEIDQMVVEHRLFLQQIGMYADKKNLMHTLNNIHDTLVEKGDINEGGETNTKGKVLQLWAKYKRVTAIAASIAGITALLISLLITQFSPASLTKSDVQELSKKINVLENKTNVLNAEIKKNQNLPAAHTYTTGGTGFLIDGRGYLITNAHVLKGKGVVVNNNGVDLTATIAYVDADRDLALLKIDDKAFKPIASLPYSFKHSNFNLGSDVYTLGYPRDIIVYNSGYISATSGHDGDTSSLQISLPANPGNSGGPVLNKNGEVVGILSAREAGAEGVVFAVKSNGIYDMLNDLKKEDTSYQSIRMPQISALKKLDREQQIKRVSDYVYQVKVYN
ncbi:MAG: serine protease [Bacteroidota bacterium]|nr:serine protease [Bacteroidota bacterium]